MRLPPQSSIQQTDAVARRARELLLRHDRVRHVHWFLGTSAPKFFYNMLEGEDGTPSFGQAYVQLDRPGDDLAALLNELQDQLDRELPEAQFLVRQLEQRFTAALATRLGRGDEPHLGEPCEHLLGRCFILRAIPQSLERP